jgi:ABC-type phosphate transport system permease subunit
MPMAYGTAAILIIVILAINVSAYLMMRYFLKKYS